jgi:hypothetical protein
MIRFEPARNVYRTTQRHIIEGDVVLPTSGSDILRIHESLLSDNRQDSSVGVDAGYGG